MSVDPAAFRNEILWMARIFSIIGVFSFGFWLGQAWARRP